MTQYFLAQAGNTAFIIEPEIGSGGFLLLTLKPGGCWDSWHGSLEEAKAQASADIGTIVGPWREIDKAFREELIRSRGKDEKRLGQ